ncbi:MAG: ZIP family metal transporter [Patescibacteria group bacterium]
MHPLLASIIATFIVSLISLVGIIFITIKEEKLKKILLLLVGFSAGALMGGAFLHLIPEAVEKSGIEAVNIPVLVGFALFFVIERVLHWHHCHEDDGKCDVHVFAYTNLIGDGVHNFVDGLIIATSFVVDFHLGIATTFAVILHELPQEISDFGVLLYAGFSKAKALSYNFISALLAVLGAIAGYFLSNSAESFASWLLPFAAGGFIYIAASDLIPELHKEKNIHKAWLSFFMFILGVGFMWLFKVIFE